MRRVLGRGEAKRKLRAGDVLLRINGKVVGRCEDLEFELRRNCLDAQAREKQQRQQELEKQPLVLLELFREGHTVQCDLRPTLLPSEEPSRLLMWAGMVCRTVPRTILERCSDRLLEALPAGEGVFADKIHAGSPADTSEFPGNVFLTQIGGCRVETLDDLKRAVLEEAKEQDGRRRWVRISYLDFSGRPQVTSLKSDPLFFPAFELRRLDGDSSSSRGWVRRALF